jgi:hypothetical protein
LNEESSSLLEEELHFVFLPLIFALSFLFSAVGVSSLLVRSSKVGALEATILEPSSLLVGLPSSSNFGGTSSISPDLHIASPKG